MGWAEVIIGVLALATAFLTYMKGRSSLGPQGKKAVAANEAMAELIQTQVETLVEQREQIQELERELHEAMSDLQLIEVANSLYSGVDKLHNN